MTKEKQKKKQKQIMCITKNETIKKLTKRKQVIRKATMTTNFKAKHTSRRTSSVPEPFLSWLIRYWKRPLSSIEGYFLHLTSDRVFETQIEVQTYATEHQTHTIAFIWVIFCIQLLLQTEVF
jgi:hypothetical protein